MKKILILSALFLAVFGFATGHAETMIFAAIVPGITRDMLQEARRMAKNDKLNFTPGEIRVEVAIANNKNLYNFNVQLTGSETVTERKLDRNDLFFVTHYGLLLLKRLSTLTGHERLFSYPDRVEFADDSTNFIGQHLNVMYAGDFRVTIDNNVIIQRQATRDFMKLPNRQGQAAAYYAINAAGAEATSSVLAAASKSLLVNDPETDPFAGLVESNPNFILSGSNKNEISATIPVHASHKVANTVSNTTNYLVFIAKGLIASK